MNDNRRSVSVIEVNFMKLMREEALARRHRRVRAKISGTQERPRLAVHRSLQHIYAQVIDDTRGAHFGRCVQ